MTAPLPVEAAALTATRRAQIDEHLLRGWVAYGLRQVTIERMRPDLMQVETTSICNLACVFCPYPQLTRPKQHMDLEDFQRLLNQQCGHIATVGLHHFGEPLLNPRLPDFIRACAQRGISATVSSNLTVLRPGQAEAIVMAGLGRLIISLDATNPADYERLRVGGRYARVLANIEAFLDAKLRLGGGPMVQVQMILTPENADSAEAFVQAWSGMAGVDQVVVRDERTHAGQVRRHDAYATRPGERLPCRYLWESLVILSDGRVVPCCKDAHGRQILGNVFAGDRLEEIWNGPALRALRTAHVKGQWAQLPLCASCTEWPGHAAMSPQQSEQSYQAFRAMKSQLSRDPVHRRGFE